MRSAAGALLGIALASHVALALNVARPGRRSLREHSKAARPKTNLIYVLADDLGYGELGCYGQKIIKTPYLDRMAAEGMRFTDHHSGSPICSPSRCSLMTGKHAGHASMINNHEVDRRHYPMAEKGATGQKPLKPGEVTIAHLAKRSGYRTGAVGKWGLGGRNSTGDPNRMGFDHFFGFYDQRDAHHYYTDWLWRNGKPVELKDNPRLHKWYSHDLIYAESERFIKESRARPFFLYMAPTIPHAEMVVPDDELFRSYDGINETEPWGDNAPYQAKRISWGLYNYAAKPHQTQAAMISRLDRDMGRMMDLLRELGIHEHTLVMFSSDNGASDEGGADPAFFHSSGGLNGMKHSSHEGGIRVPMIAWQPSKIKAGITSNYISAFWDVMPTAAELFGTQCPSDSDGISMLPTLYGTGHQKEHEYLYWKSCGQRAVRKGRWKLVTAAAGGEELYDLETDPGESHRVQKDHPEILEDLMAVVREFENHTDLE